MQLVPETAALRRCHCSQPAAKVLRRRHRYASGFKPKFHYADFATKSGTSSRQIRGRVADTNHKGPRHKSRRGLS